MTRLARYRKAAVAALLAVGSACGGAEPPPRLVVEPVVVPRPAIDTVTAAAVTLDPEIPLRDRWRAPFAVSSSGQLDPREPRRVVVLGDSTRVGTPGDPNPSAPPPSRPGLATDSLPPAPPPAAAYRTHEVVAGETLWEIARRYQVSPDEIRRLNRLTGDDMAIGSRLVIPPVVERR